MITDLGERNVTFIYNHERILGQVIGCIDEGYLPSVTLLAEKTSLSRKTVYEHINYIQYYNLGDKDWQLVQIRRRRLLERLYQYAVGSWDSDCGGSLKALEMYLKYTVNANSQFSH